MVSGYSYPIQLEAASLHPGIIVAIVAVALGLVFVGRLCVNRLCVTPVALDQQTTPIRDAAENRLMSGGTHTRIATSDVQYTNLSADGRAPALTDRDTKRSVESLQLQVVDTKVVTGVATTNPCIVSSPNSPSISGPDKDGEYPPERALQQIEVAIARGAPVVRAGDQLEAIDMDDGSDNEYGDGED